MLASAGAALAVNYRERELDAASVVEAIEHGGGRAVAVRADVSSSADVAAMMGQVKRQLGDVDILVNNAGIATLIDFADLDEHEFDRTLAVNLKSAFLCTQAVLPAMRAQRWGRIINISSAAARGPGIIGVHYNASKAGLEGLTRGYAARVASEGVTVNAVAPGPVDTEMAAPLKASNVAARLPVGRLGTADEIALAVLMLATNGFVTGQTVAVNGGVSFI